MVFGVTNKLSAAGVPTAGIFLSGAITAAALERMGYLLKNPEIIEQEGVKLNLDKEKVQSTMALMAVIYASSQAWAGKRLLENRASRALQEQAYTHYVNSDGLAYEAQAISKSLEEVQTEMVIQRQFIETLTKADGDFTFELVNVRDLNARGNVTADEFDVVKRRIITAEETANAALISHGEYALVEESAELRAANSIDELARASEIVQARLAVEIGDAHNTQAKQLRHSQDLVTERTFLAAEEMKQSGMAREKGLRAGRLARVAGVVGKVLLIDTIIWAVTASIDLGLNYTDLTEEEQIEVFEVMGPFNPVSEVGGRSPVGEIILIPVFEYVFSIIPDTWLDSAWSGIQSAAGLVGLDEYVADAIESFIESIDVEISWYLISNVLTVGTVEGTVVWVLSNPDYLIGGVAVAVAAKILYLEVVAPLFSSFFSPAIS